MQEIRVTDIEHFKIGQAEDRVSGTGPLRGWMSAAAGRLPESLSCSAR